MKNYIIALLLFIPIFTFAQTGNAKDKQLFVGYISAGMNASQVGGDLMAGYKRLGGNFGVGAYIMYTPRFSNSIELSYTMKGSQSALNNKAPEFFKKYILDYIEIPLQFNYHDKKISIFHGGIVFGRLIRSKNEGGINDVNQLNFNPWEISLMAGITFRIKERFGLNIKGTFGLTNLLKDDSGYSIFDGGRYEHHTVIDGAYEVEAFAGGSQGVQSNASKARKNGWYSNTVSLRFSYLFVPKPKQ